MDESEGDAARADADLYLASGYVAIATDPGRGVVKTCWLEVALKGCRKSPQSYLL